MNAKIVCLDQNAWIELSRAYYGNSNDSSIASIPSMLFDLAHKGSHIFPISFERLHETTKISNPERRRRLARFMVDLSDGLTIGPAYKRTIPFECRNHIIELYNLPVEKYDIQKELISKNIPGVFGAKATLIPAKPDPEPIPPVLRELLMAKVNGRELLYQILAGDNEEFRQACVRETESIYNEAVQVMEKNLTEIPPGIDKKERRNQALAQFFNQTIIPYIADAALKAHVSLDTPTDKTPELTPEEFLRKSLPSAYVSFEFRHMKDKLSGGRVMKNDFNDVSFLSYAIPYSSVVVTERTWVQLAKQLKLDLLYGSNLLAVSEISRLRDLLS